MKSQKLYSPILLLAFLAAGCASSSSAGTNGPAANGSVFQPGAPGEDSRTFASGQIEEIEGAAHTEADVRFMQGMIHHHAQALRMTALVPDRTRNEAFRSMALRMRISQTDEIGLMQAWLRDRGLEAPDPMGHSMLMHMPGMLSAEQMEALAAAEGVEFERLFLQGMIQHHGGAIVMVQDLFASPGAGQESTINFFANEVDSDQVIEIQRMQQMLAALGNGAA